MGLFFKKKAETKMDIPPPPPGEVNNAPEMPVEAPVKEETLPKLPELEEIRPKSDIAPIKPAREKLPEFPEVPEDMPSEEEVSEVFGAEQDEEDSVEENEESPQEKWDMPSKQEVEDVMKSAKAEEGPKFLNVSNFQDIVSHVDSIKESMKKADESIKSIEKLKEDEEKHFAKWRTHLEGVEKKLSYVDKVIFKGE